MVEFSTKAKPVFLTCLFWVVGREDAIYIFFMVSETLKGV